MAARPAKRQRRSLTVQSDDEASEGGSIQQSRRTTTITSRTEVKKNGSIVSKATTPQKRRLTNTSSTASPKSSPEKARKISKKVEAPNKSLHSFFGRATNEQRWKRKSETPETDLQDLIEDDISDDQSIGDVSKKTDIIETGLLNRMRTDIPSSSQKFVKPPLLSRHHTSQSSFPEVNVDLPENKPWADRYGPDNLEELAVHKKKVADVQKWLQDVFAGRIRHRLLVLKGPAGSGKTSTVSLLASNLNIEILPWHNSTVSEAGIASNMQQFGEFLSRGGGFGSLAFENEAPRTTSTSEGTPRLLLIEEFPTVNSRISSSLSTFRSTILQYLASSSQHSQLGKPSLSTHPPIVMLISETLLSSSTALNDSFTAHRLLGPDISNHPLAAIMEFNPIATTFVQKALDLVIKKEARDSRRRRTPGPAVIQKLAEIGDIRSAINSLEFLCARGDEDGSWSGTVAGRGKKKDNVPLTDMEKNTLQLVSQRESTLDMFHAAGKIVYNKREDPRVLDTRAEPPPKPPDHLLYLYTTKVSQVDIDALLNETGTDIQTFISTLHENYVLSCNGDDFTDTLDGCASILSDSDYLNPESRTLTRGRANANVATNFAQSGNSDMLRQDEISFQTASRGLLFNLPFPVSRAVPPGTRKQDAFKMFYPASMRLWKPTEEIYDLVSIYASFDYGTSSHGSNSTPIGSGTNNGVASWRSRGFGVHTVPSNTDSTQENATEPQEFPPPKAVTSRDNYVLEILPYMTKIRTASSVQSTTPMQNQQSTSQDLQNLKKITQLRGINLTLAGEEPDDDENNNNNNNNDIESTTPDTQTTTPNPTGQLIKPSTRSREILPPSPKRMSFGQKIQAAHDSIRNQQHQNNPSTSFGSGTGTGQSSSTSTVAHDVSVTAMDKLYISDDDISD